MKTPWIGHCPLCASDRVKKLPGAAMKCDECGEVFPCADALVRVGDIEIPTGSDDDDA